MTSKGKGPQILNVSATLASQTRVTLKKRTVSIGSAWVCSFATSEVFVFVLAQVDHYKYFSVLQF